MLFVLLQNLMEVCFELGIGIQTLQIDDGRSLDYIRFLLMILLSNEAICHVGTITMPCYTYLFLEIWFSHCLTDIIVVVSQKY